MTPLKKGDPCRVRLHTGEVVEAVYDEPRNDLDKYGEICKTKDHWLRSLCGCGLLAVGKPELDFECRFVGPACALVPIGESK